VDALHACPPWGAPFPVRTVGLGENGRTGSYLLLASLGGRSFDVEDVVFDGGATAYRTFVVHRKPRLKVKEKGSGEERDIALFGSVIEYDGRYKLFSYVVNR
jgi:hypothetical protein